MINSDVSTFSQSLTGRHRIARSLVFQIMQRLEGGQLVVRDPELGEQVFGSEVGGLQAVIDVRHPSFYRRLLAGGSIGAGEAYMEAWWDSPDLTKVIRLFARNLALMDKIESRSGWLARLGEKIRHWTRRNTKDQAKQNIAAHYDLGNDFYQLFLDRNMLYSSGIYPSESASLEQAQYEKMDRLCRQLQLQPDDHLLEIGTGWGALAIHAAKHYGCRVTTTTISEAQHDMARERIVEAGLEDKITLLLEDYRDLKGSYDKIVSVEMVEAVGHEYLETYMKQCQRLLKPGGTLAIQAITIADQRFEHYKRNVDFIQKYIFPGGFLPSVTQLAHHFTHHTDLVVRDIKDIGLDYARTLSDWHHRFSQVIDTVQALYDEKFVRMWRFYLCYCEGGFLERSVSTVQLIATRPGGRH